MAELSKLLWRIERLQRMEPDSYDWQAEILELIVGHPEAAERLDLAWVLVDLAICYAHLGRHNDAISTLRRAMEIDPKPPFFRRLLIAEGFLRTGREDDAETLYCAMKAEDPNNLRLYYNVGTALQDAGYHERAIQWFDEGLQKVAEPDDSAGLVSLLAIMKADSETAQWLASTECKKVATRGSAHKRKRGA